MTGQETNYHQRAKRAQERLLQAMRHGLVRVSVLLGAMAFSANMFADSLLLRGGEKLVGRVISEDAEKVIFESQTLGRLTLKADSVERIERDAAAATAENNSAGQLTPVAGPASAPANQFLPWTSERSGSDTADWIQLKSGEWLAGKIKSLQDEKLEFDSEELDLHVFDWKDIRTLRSQRLLSAGFELHKTQDGSMLVTTNVVYVMSGTTTNVYPRAELLALAPTGAREVNRWSGKVSAGVSFRSGNTREADFNAHAALQRRTPSTRLSLDYIGNYSKVNGVETEQNHRFTDQFDNFLSRRLYLRVPDLEYYRDPLQNISHRLTLGGGAGYDLVKTARTEWDVTLGPAWQANWFQSVESSQDSFATSLAMVFATRLDIELSKRLDFIAEYRGQLTSPETGNNTHHAVATIEFEIHKRLKLDLSFQWDRITSPKAEANGNAPTPDDFRLITSLGVDF